MPINKTDLINQIKWYSIYLDWNIAFSGKARGNRHLFRVNKIIKFLAKTEKADLFISELGGWIHDLSLIKGNDDKPENIKKIVEEFLDTLTLDSQIKSKIIECAIAHEGDKKALSKEAKIVHDADVIDKSGILGIIRHSWKVVNMIKPDITSNELLILLEKHLKDRQKKLYTKTAKIIADKLNNSNKIFLCDIVKAKATLEIIMPMAKKGITSDNIALFLIKNKNFFSDQLKNQLKCNYLK